MKRNNQNIPASLMIELLTQKGFTEKNYNNAKRKAYKSGLRQYNNPKCKVKVTPDRYAEIILISRN